VAAAGAGPFDGVAAVLEWGDLAHQSGRKASLARRESATKNWNLREPGIQELEEMGLLARSHQASGRSIRTMPGCCSGSGSSKAAGGVEHMSGHVQGHDGRGPDRRRHSLQRPRTLPPEPGYRPHPTPARHLSPRSTWRVARGSARPDIETVLQSLEESHRIGNPRLRLEQTRASPQSLVGMNAKGVSARIRPDLASVAEK